MRVALLLVTLAACGGTTAPRGDTTLDREMTTMRAYDQHVGGLSAVPVMTAAEDVFAKVQFIGKTHAEVAAMIGAPLKDDAGVWQYYFGNGVVGVVRYFHFTGDRVSSVQVVMTQ